MSAHLSSAPGTFRDPAGRLCTNEDRILREIYPQHVQSVLEWVRSPLAQRLDAATPDGSDDDSNVRARATCLTRA
jgi:hypothetical protein